MTTASIKIEGEKGAYLSANWSDPDISFAYLIVNRRLTLRQVLDDFVSEKEDVEIVIIVKPR